MSTALEYRIHNIPVFLFGELQKGVSATLFCDEVEELLPKKLFSNIEVIYIGEFPNLKERTAAFADGAIYISSGEKTTTSMVENFVHETAHSLEQDYGQEIFSADLVDEFSGKRTKLYQILKSYGYKVQPSWFQNLEYSKEFDEFLANKIGYPILKTITAGLFVSPYGATSLQEYYANGFEKFFLDKPKQVKYTSPVLYKKIVSIINDPPV
jgi:hypothetical protein